MNTVRRIAVFIHARVLALLFVLATVLLVAQFLCPFVRHWWRLPGAGQTGFDTFQAPTLADEFVIHLPRSYHNGRLWPLVVYLHGSGERGNDPSILRGQESFRAALPAIVAAPQCLAFCDWEPNTVADFIHYVASQYHVDSERIYLVGFSIGAYATWQTAAAHPEMFAAIVPISGGGDPTNIKALAETAIW